MNTNHHRYLPHWWSNSELLGRSCWNRCEGKPSEKGLLTHPALQKSFPSREWQDYLLLYIVDNVPMKVRVGSSIPEEWSLTSDVNWFPTVSAHPVSSLTSKFTCLLAANNSTHFSFGWKFRTSGFQLRSNLNDPKERNNVNKSLILAI